MSTANDYMEKTAKLHGFTAKGMSDFQKMLLSQKDEVAKATASSAKSVGDQFAGITKGLDKSKKSLKKMKKNSTKRSLMYGGGAGAGTGYLGGKAGQSNEEI